MINTQTVREIVWQAQESQAKILELCNEVDNLRKDNEELLHALEDAMHVIHEHPVLRGHARELYSSVNTFHKFQNGIKDKK